MNLAGHHFDVPYVVHTAYIVVVHMYTSVILFFRKSKSLHFSAYLIVSYIVGWIENEIEMKRNISNQ